MNVFCDKMFLRKLIFVLKMKKKTYELLNEGATSIEVDIKFSPYVPSIADCCYDQASAAV